MDSDDTPPDGNLDKVRELLFGEQQRTTDQRLGRLGDKFGKALKDVREDLVGRLASLDQYARDELGALGGRQDDHRGEATAFRQEVEERLAALGRSLDERLASLVEEHERALGDLRTRLLDQSRELRDELDARHRALSDEVAADLTALQGAKADRALLSAMFAELAVRLSDQDLVPPAAGEAELVLDDAMAADGPGGDAQATPTDVGDEAG